LEEKGDLEILYDMVAEAKHTKRETKQQWEIAQCFFAMILFEGKNQGIQKLKNPCHCSARDWKTGTEFYPFNYLFLSKKEELFPLSDL